MKIDDKISILKKTIQEIKNITDNKNNNDVSEKKIDELNNEILKLKQGIIESIEELEEFLEEDNARS